MKAENVLQSPSTLMERSPDHSKTNDNDFHKSDLGSTSGSSITEKKIGESSSSQGELKLISADSSQNRANHEETKNSHQASLYKESQKLEWESIQDVFNDLEKMIINLEETNPGSLENIPESLGFNQLKAFNCYVWSSFKKKKNNFEALVNLEKESLDLKSSSEEKLDDIYLASMVDLIFEDKGNFYGNPFKI